jgi:hypothetical protein
MISSSVHALGRGVVVSLVCRSRVLLLAMCTLFGACARYGGSTGMTDDVDAVCRITFAHFCINRIADGFLISVSQKAMDIHGYIYFVEGIGREDKSKRFLLIVRNLDSGRDMKLTPEFCNVFGLTEETCTKGVLRVKVMQYEERLAEEPSFKSEQGIRVDLINAENIDPDILTKLVYPCVHTRSDKTTCSASLPVCRRSTKWLNCDVLLVPKVAGSYA